MEGIIVTVGLILAMVVVPAALAWIFHQASVGKL